MSNNVKHSMIKQKRKKKRFILKQLFEYQYKFFELSLTKDLVNIIKSNNQ